MATEYIYDALRATSDEDITISAIITDEDGAAITDSCYLSFFDDERELVKVYGTFDGEQWTFTIPAEDIVGLTGRYFYTIGRNFKDMCFKSPIYLV